MATAHLQRGRDALARGAWEDALHAFDLAVRQERSADALEGLGEARWWLNDGPRVFEAREEAYRRYHERGDRASAARIALWLYWDYRAVSSGWIRRAERLLEGLESTQVRLAAVPSGRSRVVRGARSGGSAGAYGRLPRGRPRVEARRSGRRRPRARRARVGHGRRPRGRAAVSR